MSFERFHPPMDNRDGPPGLFHPPGLPFSGGRLQPPGFPFSGDRLQPPGFPFSGDCLQPPGFPFSGDRLQPPGFPFSGDRLQPPGFPFSGDCLQPPGFPFSGDRLQPPGFPFSGDRLQPPDLPFSGDRLQPPGLPFSGDRLQPPDLPFSGDRLQPPDLPFSGDRLQPPGFPFRGSQPVLLPERGLSESVRIGPSLWLYNKQQEQGDIPRPQHPFDSCVTQNGSERQKLLQDLSQKQIKLASLRTEMAKLVMGQNDSMQQTGVVNSNLPRLIEIETALASLTKEVGRLLRASFPAPHLEKIDVPEKTLDRKPPFMEQKPLVIENPPRPNAGKVGDRAAVGQWGLPPTYNQSYDQHSRDSHGQASVDKTYSSFTSKVGDRKSQATNDADRKHKRGYSKSSNKQHSSSSRDVRKSFRDRHPRVDRNSSRDRHHRDDRDSSCDSHSWNGDEQKSTKQRKDDDWEAGKLAKQNIDALLQDDELKNILFAFVEMSKATAKLEQSLKTTYKKFENYATTDDSFSRHEAQQSAQTSPADVPQKPKSILKRKKRVDVETVEEGVNVESQVSSDPFSKLSGLWKASFKPVGTISQLESCDDSDSGNDNDPGDSRGQARVDSTYSSFNSKAGDRIFPATDDAYPKHQRGYSKSSDKQRSSSSPDDQMNSSYGHPSENLASSHDSYPHDDPTTFYGSHSQGRELMSSLKKKPEERVDAESKTSSVPAGKGKGKDSTFPDIWGLLYEQFRQPINNPSKVWQATSKEQDVSKLDHLFQDPRHAHNFASSSQTKKAGDDDEELDSTVQDILQSIEFKTALSKQDVLHTGMIKQSASFLEHRSRSRSSDRRRSRSSDRRRSRSPDRRRSRSSDRRRSRSPDRHRCRLPDRRRSRSVKRHTPRREARLKGSRSPGRHRSQSSSQSRSRSTDRRRSRSPRGQPSRARSPERHGSHHFLIQRNVSTSLKLHIDDTIIRY